MLSFDAQDDVFRAGPISYLMLLPSLVCALLAAWQLDRRNSKVHNLTFIVLSEWCTLERHNEYLQIWCCVHAYNLAYRIPAITCGNTLYRPSNSVQCARRRKSIEVHADTWQLVVNEQRIGWVSGCSILQSCRMLSPNTLTWRRHLPKPALIHFLTNKKTTCSSSPKWLIKRNGDIGGGRPFLHKNRRNQPLITTHFFPVSEKRHGYPFDCIASTLGCHTGMHINVSVLRRCPRYHIHVSMSKGCFA